MKRIALIFPILIYIANLYCQSQQWQNWQYDGVVCSVASQGRFVWIGTNITGLVKLDTITNERTFYNTSNSPIISNSVTCIKIDNSGRVWTNAGGLTCLDGTDWTVYSPDNSNMPACSVVEFDIDPFGNIWLATSIGLVKFDGTVWAIFDSSNSPLPYDIHYHNAKNSVAVDSTGKVWVSNSSAWSWTISSFQNNIWQTYSMTQLGFTDNWIPVYCLETDINDTLWMGTGYGGLMRMAGSEITIFNDANSGIPGNWVKCITFDLDGNVWMGAWNDSSYWGGVARYDGTSWSSWIVCGLRDGNIDFNVVNCISTQPDRVWAGTSRGLNEYDGIDWHNYSFASNGLVNQLVEGVIVDHNDLVWFICGGSTVGQALMTFDGNTWGHHDGPFQGPCVDHQNRIWTINRSIIKRYDNNTHIWENIAIPPECNPLIFPFINININGLAFESDDSVWLATSRNIGRFQNGTGWTVFTPDNSGLLINDVTGEPEIIIGVYIDNQDNAWICTDSKGLIKYNGSDWSYYNESTTGLQIVRPGSVIVDNENNLWIVETRYNTLLRYDGVNWSSFNTSNSPIPSGDGTTYLFGLSMDAHGKIWLGTSKGLCIIDDDNWQVFTTANSGLPNNYITSVAFDSAGNAWIGTLDGLAVYHDHDTEIDDDTIVPHYSKYQLKNYPNPFKIATNICFVTPRSGKVKLSLYNLKGQKVTSLYDGYLIKGNHDFSFNIDCINTEISNSGIYFVKMEFENATQIIKITNIK